MPIEVRRFGVGHRRPDGPPGSEGLTGQVIHSDGRGIVAELAFSRGGRIQPHSSPNSTFFVVIEGGGWVQVGDERIRVAAGEAIVWPPNVVHGAWTDYSNMRALVIEFAGDDAAGLGILEGAAKELPAGAASSSPAEGGLVPPDRPVPHDRSEGEPV
ncbi:MAG TPA: cupin domain-containing protein [Candidatus Limnocylindrales bacterium]|nr:cupin domain-containing protein [Candidatus Limnocylindrales bacterium]